MTPLMYKFDPLNKLPDTPDEVISEACGILPLWLVNAPDDEKMLDTFKREYQFPFSESTGGKLDTDGTYLYPEDPPLYPLLMVYKPSTKETYYQYSYAWVAIEQEDGSTYFTRLD